MKRLNVILALALWILCCDSIFGLKNETEIATKKEDVVVQEIVGRISDGWNWIRSQARDEHTFVGRCAGAFKKMRMALTFIIFKLGVIVTSLAFLSVLAFKSIGIGVATLLVSSVGLATKFYALKQADHGHQPGGGVHVHLYKGDHGHGYYERPWGLNKKFDRIVPKNDLEKMAIADLYKRLKLEELVYGSGSDVEINGYKFR